MQLTVYLHFMRKESIQPCNELALTVLVATIDAQWEGMGECRVSEVRAGTTSPMPDHKGFKLQ